MKWKDGEGIWDPEAAIHPGLGLRKGKLEIRSLESIKRIIVHHTGVGILGRFARDKDRFGWYSPNQAAIHVYTRIMAACGHYSIGWKGEIVQYVPDNWTAWHAGYGKARRRRRLAEWFDRMRYRKRLEADVPAWLVRKDGRFDWWLKRWWATRRIPSPTFWFPDLDVNGGTIGIELVSTPGKEPFRPLQLRALRTLLARLSNRHQVPLDEDHALTHSDVCPLSRTTKGGVPWDPPPAKYSFSMLFGSSPANVVGISDALDTPHHDPLP